MKKLKNVVLTLMSVFLILLMTSALAWSADVTVTTSQMKNSKVFSTRAEAIVFTALDETGSFTIKANAKVHSLSVKMPDWTNDVTGTLTITNVHSYELYSKSAIAEDHTTHVYNLAQEVALDGLHTVKLTLSGVPGGVGGTAHVVLWLE